MSFLKKSAATDGEKTLMPVKKQSTSKRVTLSQLTRRTLGSGNMFDAVKVPEGEDENEWIAANTVDFYNELSLLYGLVADDTKRFTKPGEGFPPDFEYRWVDGPTKNALRVSSPEYVDYVMTWIEDQIDDEEIFPVSESQPFPDDFLDYIKDIFKKMFRIFAILYHQHYSVIEEEKAQAHINSCFKHFLFFCLHFDLLVDERELRALEGLVKRLRAKYVEEGGEPSPRWFEPAAKEAGPEPLGPEPLDWAAALAAAVRNGDAQVWGRAKLMVVGQGAAGKTSTVRSLLGEAFVPEHMSTRLMDVTRTRAAGDLFRRLQPGERDFDAQVVKAAAAQMEPVPPKRSSGLRERVVGAVEKAVKRLSLGSAQPLATLPPDDIPLPALLEDEEVARRFDVGEAQALHARTKDGTQVSFSLWDYGGQEVFYALHHTFLTQQGLYLLVFDMRELLGDGDEAGRYLRFWLNSIQLHAPQAPVLLVGTHLDAVSDLRSVNKDLRERTNLSQYQVVANSAQGLHFFPIDNSSSQLGRADALRAAIVAETVAQDYVTRPVSLRWLSVQDAMLTAGKPFLKLADVVELCREKGVQEGDVGEMLALFHGLGGIVHLTATEALNDIVVVDPQWLIDKLVKVIADTIHVEHLFTDPGLRRKGLMPDFEALRSTGLASRELLEHLWGGEEVEYLLDFMTQNLLLCKWRHGERRDMFLATSLLPKMREAPDLSAYAGGLVAQLDFSKSYLPNGVFQRLVAQCATYAAEQEDGANPVLSSSVAQLAFGLSTFVMKALADRIEIRINPESDSAPQVVKVLVSMLRRQLAAVFNGLSWLLLLVADGAAVEYDKLEAARALGKTKMHALRPNGALVTLASFNAFFVDAEVLGRLDDEAVLEVAHAQLRPLPPGIKHHAFLSHKQIPGAYLTKSLALSLEKRGLRVWYDMAHQGELNKEALLDGVRESKCFVLVLTKDVFKSAPVRLELKTALQEGKPVLLVHAADTENTGVFAPFSEHIAALPKFAPADFFDVHESMPFVHRYYLEAGFMAELIKRIDQSS